MKNISTNSLSHKYLHVISCDRQEFCERNMKCLRPDGRADYHILYITKGKCFVKEGKKEIEAGEGSMVVYLPYERQEYEYKKDINTVVYYIHFSGDGCRELIEKHRLFEKRVYNIGVNLRLVNIFDLLVEEYSHKRFCFEDICRSCLINILTHSGRSNILSNAKNSAATIKINEICDDIICNYSKKLSVGEYAKMCNLSESRFSHLFKEITGTSPAKYIIRTKLEKSKDMILNTDYPISEISQEVGFNDQNYFSRIFKKYYGSSPLNLRKS